MTLRRCAAAFTITLAALCTGCAGGKIDGRVIGGTAGVVQTVAAGTDRPDQPPISGAAVELRAVGRGPTGPVIATTTTGPDGRFSLKYNDRRLVRDRMQLTAQAGGYMPVQEYLYLPASGTMVLVTMRPGAGVAPPPTAPKPK
jgi:hypothetical protein